MLTVTFRRDLFVGDEQGSLRIGRSTPVDLIDVVSDGPNVVRLIVKTGERTMSRRFFVSETRNLIKVVGECR